jgi:hypothetical protein
VSTFQIDEVIEQGRNIGAATAAITKVLGDDQLHSPVDAYYALSVIAGGANRAGDMRTVPVRLGRCVW